MLVPCEMLMPEDSTNVKDIWMLHVIHILHLHLVDSHTADVVSCTEVETVWWLLIGSVSA